jgi:transposase InsO family protein
MQRSSTAFASGWRSILLSRPQTSSHTAFEIGWPTNFSTCSRFIYSLRAPPTIASMVSSYTHVRPRGRVPAACAEEGRPSRPKRFGPILALRSLWNPKGTRCSTPISSSSPMARSPRSFDRLGHRLARSWRCFDAASAVGLSELIDRRRFKTQAEARLAVFEWIEGWYNPHRRHSWLGRISPVNFERRQLQSKAA